MALLVGVGQNIVSARLQGYDGTNWQNLRVQDSTYHNLRVSIFDSGTRIESTDYNSDGKSVTKAGLLVGCMNFGYNGTNLDRIRTHYDSGNIDVTATGTTSIIDTVTGFEKHTWTQVNDASESNPNIRLQGSIDGTNWFDLDTSTSIGSEMRHVVNKPVRYIRFNVVSLGDATTITLRYFGFR